MKKLVTKQKCPWVFIEDKLKALDFLKAALDFKSVRLAKDIHRYRNKLFQWNEISVYPLFRGLINASVYSIPARLLLMTAMQRTTAEFNATLLGLYGFEFGTGKAVISGARRGIKDLKVWGLQHGPIAPGKIFYDVNVKLPGVPHLPDKVLLDGDYAAELMRSFNFPTEQILTLGPLRFNRLDATGIIQHKDNNQKKILVAPGLHDCQSMLQFVLKSLGDIPDIDLIIKIHPQCPYDFESSPIKKFITKARYVLEQRPLADLLQDIDLAVVSYSTVGLEALQAGIPVIEIRPDYGIDWGLFSAQEDARRLATNPAELRNIVINEDWSAIFNAKSAASLISQVFTQGNITARYVSAIEKELS